jgi:hypothetical protein
MAAHVLSTKKEQTMTDYELQPENEEAASVENPQVEPEDTAAEIEMIDNTAATQAVSERDVVVNESLVVAAVAGRDMQLSDSMVAGPTVVGRDLTLEESMTGMILTGSNANVQNGSVGILVAGGAVSFSEDSRVLMTGKMALAMGAAFGVVFGLLSWLRPRKK